MNKRQLLEYTVRAKYLENQFLTCLTHFLLLYKVIFVLYVSEIDTGSCGQIDNFGIFLLTKQFDYMIKFSI